MQFDLKRNIYKIRIRIEMFVTRKNYVNFVPLIMVTYKVPHFHGCVIFILFLFRCYLYAMNKVKGLLASRVV